jgi:hypothetical protein
LEFKKKGATLGLLEALSNSLGFSLDVSHQHLHLDGFGERSFTPSEVKYI